MTAPNVYPDSELFGDMAMTREGTPEHAAAYGDDPDDGRTLSVWVDPHTYPGDASGLDTPEFPSTFARLGGASAVFTPSWVHGLPVGEVFLSVTGTAAAVAYVESLLS